MSVVIETTIGDITVDLYLKERPNTCINFLKLCKVKYYNLCLFHKIETNFIAQTGDPTGTGRGGESIFCELYGDQAKYFDSEFKPRLKHEKLGTLSMVNNGNNMNGSQFFLTLGENLTYLDEVHTVFGEVVAGFDVLLKLNEAICDSNNRPYQDIRITHTVILHDPYDDPKDLKIPNSSPEPTREQLETDYIGADEEIDDTKGKNAEEVEEKIKESEAKARATILEMVGDIPDADVKPPENVLFVCKLNPVTTSEDLDVIFSRFGPIISCEVIKDRKTGESLQYAFIEFEKEQDCENAYFKMDNVLIDDRRIHVDFSQSVSKMNWDKNEILSKNQSVKFQNVVLKNKPLKDDGYDLIFDMNDSPSELERDKKNYGHRSKTTEHKHSHSERYKVSDNRQFPYRKKTNDKYDMHIKDKINHRSRSETPEQECSHSYKNKERYHSQSPDFETAKKHSELVKDKRNHRQRSETPEQKKSHSEKHKHSHSKKHKHSDIKHKEKYHSSYSKKHKHKSRRERSSSSEHSYTETISSRHKTKKHKKNS